MADLCHKEEEIVAAVIAGNLTEAQSEHLANCAECRSAAAMVGLLQAEKQRSLAESDAIPPADVLWIKAAYEVHEKRKRRRKLVIMAGVLMGLIVGFVTTLIVWPSGAVFSPEAIMPRMSLPAKLFFPAAITAVIVGLMLYIEHMSNPKSICN